VRPALEEKPDVDAERKEQDEEDDDDDDDDEDEEKKGNDAQPTIQELQAAFGPYTPEAGWSVLPAPTSSQEAYDQKNLKKYFAADRRGAFLWDDSWNTGTFKLTMKAKGGPKVATSISSTTTQRKRNDHTSWTSAPTVAENRGLCSNATGNAK